MLVADTEHLVPFWSWVSWFRGDTLTGIQVVQNVMMFVPLGFILQWINEGKGKCNGVVRSLLTALAVSVLIESSQLIFMLGTAEFDDLFDNTLGAFIGILGYMVMARITWVRKFQHAFVLGLVVIGFVVCVVYVDRSDSNNLEQQFAFQVDNVECVSDGTGIDIDGFCFIYKDPSRSYDICFKDVESGETYDATIEIGLVREDVNEYFKCEYDYTHSGFKAHVDCPTDESYEVYVKWPRARAIPTGAFINDRRSYSSADSVIDEVMSNGILKVEQTDADCLVYQYDGQLYWIVGQDFKFDKSGATYIQYQLDTTQPDRLPQIRQENNWDWDNIGFVFEEYEVTDPDDLVDGYRMAVRPLPTEYAITDIYTGYYEIDRWQWKKTFRPRWND